MPKSTSDKQKLMYLAPSRAAMQDEEIRKYGFKIAERPVAGDTLWERNEKLYRQEEVLILMEKEDPLPVAKEVQERPAYKKGT